MMFCVNEHFNCVTSLITFNVLLAGFSIKVPKKLVLFTPKIQHF